MADRLHLLEPQQERRLRAMNEDFARLRADRDAWAEFKAEAAIWDRTSGDEPPCR